MRIEFTSAVKRAAYDRSNGCCECHRCPGLEPCGQTLDFPIFYEHIIQCEVGGDGSLDNCAVLNKTCWKAKTAKQDLPVIAKCKRINDRHRGITPRRRKLDYKLFDGSPRRGK
jgi:5-methylcytosine-specific restriction enzyme A